jgi:hypothetical protein
MEPDLGTLHRRLQDLEARQARDAEWSRRLYRQGFFTGVRAGAITLSVLALAGTLLSGQSTGDALFIDAQGRVGIGTTTPSLPLTIRHTGNGSINTDRTESSLWSGLTLNDNGAANERWFLGMPGGNNNLVWRNRAANNVFTVEDNAKGNQLYLASTGKIGIGTATPVAGLDIVGSPRTDTHPGAVHALYATGDFGPAYGIEFRHTNGSQGIGFGYNTIYATGANAGQELNLSTRGGAAMNISAGVMNVNSPMNVAGGVTSLGRYQRDTNGAESTYQVSPRYHVSLTGSTYPGYSRVVPRDTLNALCGDADGCEVRLGMTRWASGAETETASVMFLFYYSDADGRWRASENTGPTAGIDGNGAVQHAANIFNTCFFTDGAYAAYSGNDSARGMELLVWNGFPAASRTCELTLID